MKFIKFVAALLSMVIITTIAAAPLSVQAAEIDSGVDVGTTPSVRATNSFGSLLSNKLETSMSGDNEPSEYVVTYADVQNNIATVVYSAPENCKIVAAVYDENTGEMLASGNAKASAAEDIAKLDVVIDTDSMPEYFDLKVFILDEDNNPLNDCYSTNYYTSGIQEVVNSTVDDFNSEKVFNLDDDKETNFVVYSENTTLVDYTEGHNIPDTTYSKTGVYVFSKAADDIKNLKKGNNVAYKYNDEVILFKVKDIKINGDTVTVTEDENADMEEFFDCIKIDSKSSPDNVTYDRSTADEGVEFEGFVEDEDSKAPQPSSAASDTFSGDLVNLKFKIKEKTLFDFNPQEGNNLKVKVEADVLLKVGYYLQYFYKSDISDSYIRFNLDASLSLSGTLDANITLEKALGSVGWSPVFGVYIGAEPTLKGSVDFSTTGSISVSKLFAVERQTDGTVKDVSTAAKANSELKATGELYIGIDLNPKVSVINEKIFSIEGTAEFGLKLVASAAAISEQLGGSWKHLCDDCISAAVKTVAKFGVEIEIFSCDSLSYTLNPLLFEHKFCDYYNSRTYDDSGNSLCPHRGYKTEITVTDNNKAVVGVEMDVKSRTYNNDIYNGKTNKQGKVTLYLQKGDYDILINGETYSVKTQGKVDQLTVKLKSKSDNKDSDTDKNANTDKDTDKQSDTDKEPEHAVKKSHEKETTALIVSGYCGDEGDNVKWALYESGTLYIYGKGKMESYMDYYMNYYSPFGDYRNNIINVVIENGVTSIGFYAFGYGGSLKSIEIPNSVTSIGEEAFYCCKNLTNVKIPNSVTSIGNGAFEYCSSLTSIEIPNSVTNIGDLVFGGCTGLTSIEIPNSVTSIGNGAFEDCSSLTSIEIPNSVTSIGQSAFYGCSSLTSIEIPNSVTSMGEAVFWDCSSLTSIEIPNGVTSIGDVAFYGCSSLKSIGIPNSVTSIGWMAFYNCSSLKSVKIPHGITVIKEQTFCGCINLKSVEIPNSVTEIEIYAFYDCDSLKAVYFTGTQKEWENITIYAYNFGTWNDTLPEDFRIYYNSRMPKSSGSSLPNSSTATITNYLAPIPTNTKTMVVSKSANKEYTGLVQNGRYIFMLVKSDKAENLVASDNLVYIDQFTADENGAVTADYPDSYGNEYTALILGGKTTVDTTIEDTDSDTDTETDVDTDSDTDTETDVDTNSDTDTETDVDTDSDTETDVDTDSDTPTVTYLLGDVDGDGRVTSADSLFILRASVKLEKLDDVQTKLADVNSDGSIDSSDSLITLRASVGLYDNPNVGKNISIKTKAA